MEVAALVGLLGMGYALTRSQAAAAAGAAATTEPFVVAPQIPYGGMPPPLYSQDRTPPGQATIPGKPRQPAPITDEQLTRSTLLFSDAPAPMETPTPQVRMVGAGVDGGAVAGYTSPSVTVSELTGLPTEMTHANMTPFYRGALKQNVDAESNRSLLDNMIGTGYDQISKREQAPLFDPYREPVGNVFGMESSTDYFQDRMVVPTNRAGERPFEPTRVGPGLNNGYTPFASGGFQQFEAQEIARQRMSIDETRTASNPRITYEGVFNHGGAINPVRGDIGETRKYRPDRFHVNEGDERLFTAPSADTLGPRQRAAEVMKFQSREETTTEQFGGAGASDFSATYTIPSFKAPHAQQHEGYGFRHADGSTYGVSDTDAAHNDFGRAGYDLPVNQRNVTSERGQALNLTVAGGPKALTVYDPNDVARTTIRETTGANDHLGVAGAVGAQKLMVYDPTDIARATGRNTLGAVDTAMNVSRAGVPNARTLAAPDGVRATIKSVSAPYGGSAGPATYSAKQTYDSAYAMRTNPTREVIAAGRRPLAGNGVNGLFNGEDNIHMTYRRPATDSLNDRSNAVERVLSAPLGADAIGLQRPKQILSLDVSRERNTRDISDILVENPYALPIHRIAQGDFHSAQPVHASTMAAMGW